MTDKHSEQRLCIACSQAMTNLNEDIPLNCCGFEQSVHVECFFKVLEDLGDEKVSPHSACGKTIKPADILEYLVEHNRLINIKFFNYVISSDPGGTTYVHIIKQVDDKYPGMEQSATLRDRLVNAGRLFRFP